MTSCVGDPKPPTTVIDGLLSKVFSRRARTETEATRSMYLLSYISKDSFTRKVTTVKSPYSELTDSPVCLSVQFPTCDIAVLSMYLPT